MSGSEQKEFQRRLARIDELVQGIAGIADPEAQAGVKELVQLVLDLHGAGLERMLDVIYESGPQGQALIDELGQDELAGSLLLLHGLHPYDLETRVRQALDKVRPYMRSHGGNVDFLGVDEAGVVRLRLQGSCHECPSSRVTLKYAVEDAIYAAAPDVTAIETEGAVAETSSGAGFIPLDDIHVSSSLRNGDGEGWVQVAEAAALPAGGLAAVELLGVPVLLARVGATLYAYGNACPHCASPLGQAALDGSDLVCPACGHRYDVVHAGSDRAGGPAHLAPFPLLEERGQARIALSAIQGAGRAALAGLRLDTA